MSYWQAYCLYRSTRGWERATISGVYSLYIVVKHQGSGRQWGSVVTGSWLRHKRVKQRGDQEVTLQGIENFLHGQFATVYYSIVASTQWDCLDNLQQHWPAQSWWEAQEVRYRNAAENPVRFQTLCRVKSQRRMKQILISGVTSHRYTPGVFPG